jgi:hypothetical protein
MPGFQNNAHTGRYLICLFDASEDPWGGIFSPQLDNRSGKARIDTSVEDAGTAASVEKQIDFWKNAISTIPAIQLSVSKALVRNRLHPVEPQTASTIER